MRKIVPSILFVAFSLACGTSLPDENSTELTAAIRSFYVGLAAMEAADDQRAKTELDNAVRLAAGEPAAWTNLGVLQMRQKDFESSDYSFQKAIALAPENGQILRNVYVLETQRGDFDKGVQSLKQAIELDANDIKARFALAREYERQMSDLDAMAAYEEVSRIKPNNLPTKLEIARLAAKQGQAEKLKVVFDSIAPRSAAWGPEIREQFQTLQDSAARSNMREVSQNIAFFRNVLLRLPEFRAEIADVRFDDAILGEPFTRPLKLPVPDFLPAIPDENLKFTPVAVSDEKARWSKAVYLDGDSPPVVAWADDKEIHIGDHVLPVAASSDLQTIDIDYNFKNDLVSVGENGLRIFDDNLRDVSARTKLAPDVLRRKYLKAFTFDVEIDGDLDLVLAAETGPPVILQNNADGTFEEIKLFSEIDGLADFASADFDEDGDMDAATVDGAGRLQLFSNERGGDYSLPTTPVSDGVGFVAFADTNGDGQLDLNMLKLDETIERFSYGKNGWTLLDAIRPKADGEADTRIDKAERPISSGPAVDKHFAVQDLDNNGALDVIAREQLYLNGGNRFSEVDVFEGGHISSGGDINGDGRIDLVGMDSSGKPAIFTNSGSKHYGWQILRPRSARAEGDQRVNSFGIGGEMEIRSGLLAQKRVIDSPQVHFGLGEQTSVDLLRIIWGNGFTQAEFDLEKDQPVLVRQRLTGSCPHLFAWNGTEFKFVKDSAPLATSLGLRISKTQTVPVEQTEEWYKIAGDQLVAKDGFYELRITDELWESYYVDHYSLMVIDHPAETDVFVNELYPVPLPLELYWTADPQPFASAVDENGDDVANAVNDLDEIYLGDLKSARYQGVTREHFVELELPADAPHDKPVNVIADGWLHPTDTSLNVAISQNSEAPPKTLSLDILNAQGVWETFKDDFGVPASKFKTVVVELPVGTKRCRLRTNSEVFWDRLAWAEVVPKAENQITRLELSQAELHFRGFSAVSKKDASSPEIADFETIATTTQRWRSIEGYYTRYGDIMELLLLTDDRYALVTAGDEMRLRFAEMPPVRDGWKRDFVIIGDGWIKEGDYSNAFSKTVLPLPTHATSDYSRMPTRLEDDPVYERHSHDWLNFHTRYVAPDNFRNAVRTR